MRKRLRAQGAELRAQGKKKVCGEGYEVWGKKACGLLRAQFDYNTSEVGSFLLLQLARFYFSTWQKNGNNPE